jgi:hypothetical protein
VCVSFRIQEDTGNLIGNVALEDAVVLTTGTISLTTNTFYTVRFVDTGSTLALYLNGDSTPFLTAATSSVYGDKVSAFNREGAGNNSYISAGSVSALDYLTVSNYSAVPEPSTYALFLSAVGMLAVARKRFICKRD